MPSIPQSLLWISLVVLWLFVLVPMLVNKRDAVRRTSDVALATRVLTSGSSARLIKRGGPAAGHAHDPHWQPEADEADDLDDADEPARVTAVTVAAAVVVTEVTARVEPDYLDVDVVDEDAAALPGAAAEADEPAAPAAPAAEEVAPAEPAGDAESLGESVADHGDHTDAEEEADEAGYPAEAAADDDGYADDEDHGDAGYADGEAHLDEDTAEDAESAPAAAPVGSAERRRRNDLKAAAAVEARKYAFRKRMLMAMAAVLVLSALAAFTAAPSAWWICGSATVVTVLYLAYLRRQTRIEQQIRARRARRVQRSRPVPEADRAEPVRVAPRRPIHPGTVPVDIDDEDPAFADLQYTSYAGDYGWRGDLPRAAGQ